MYAGRIWKGDVLVAEIEETVDASEIYSTRLNAKEVIFPKEKGELIFFQSQMDEHGLLAEDVLVQSCPERKILVTR